MTTKTKKFVLLTSILNLFNHVVITSKKIALTSFDEIASTFNESKSYSKYNESLNMLRIRLNDETVNKKTFFAELKKIKNSKSKFHAEIEYLFLLPTKTEIVYTLIDKKIQSKCVPLYVLQTINEIDKNFLVSLPKSFHADFDKSDSFEKIISHVDCAIRKLYESNHVRSMYKI